MGCVQAKEATVAKEVKAAEKGAANSVKAVEKETEKETASAVTAVENDVKQVAHEAAALAEEVVEEVKRAVAQVTTIITGSGAKEEKPWYERLLSCDGSAFCCQAPTDDNMLTSIVKDIRDRIDRSPLGIEFELGAVSINPMVGRIEVDGIKVFNPKGWSSPYLLHSDKIVAEVNMEKLLTSFGKELHLDEVVLDGVLVIYEKGLTSSNLNDLLDMLQMKQDQPMRKEVENELEKMEKEAKVESKEVVKEAKVESKEVEKEAEAGKFEVDKAKGQASEPDVQLVLRKFLARNVGAKFSTELTDGEGLRVEIDDFQYNDFQTEMGSGLSIHDHVRHLLMAFIKKVLATLLGLDKKGAIEGVAVSVAHETVETVEAK